VAERIAAGLRAAEFTAQAMAVGRVDAQALAGIDLLVVGGPTHVHGMSSEHSREAARHQAEREGSGLVLDPDAVGPGLREWFAGIVIPAGVAAAAFDTRITGPAVLTGRASKGIAKHLRHQGARLDAHEESFLVDREGRLCEGEADRAQTWGQTLVPLAGSQAAGG
jgi:hypothetical protein